MSTETSTLPPPAGALTTQEKLLLSQAVYKVGAAAWETISGLLRDHPIIQGRPADLFTPEACEQSYVALMGSIGQNVYVFPLRIHTGPRRH